MPTDFFEFFALFRAPRRSEALLSVEERYRLAGDRAIPVVFQDASTRKSASDPSATVERMAVRFGNIR